MELSPLWANLSRCCSYETEIPSISVNWQHLQIFLRCVLFLRVTDKLRILNGMFRSIREVRKTLISPQCHFCSKINPRLYLSYLRHLELHIGKAGRWSNNTPIIQFLSQDDGVSNGVLFFCCMGEPFAGLQQHSSHYPRGSDHPKAQQKSHPCSTGIPSISGIYCNPSIHVFWKQFWKIASVMTHGVLPWIDTSQLITCWFLFCDVTIDFRWTLG